MKWMIDITVGILLTTVTGSILFFVWYSIGKILERAGFINVMYELLKVVLLFWLLPVSYAILVGMNEIKWGGFLFRYTKSLGIFCTILCILWLLGVAYFIVRYVSQIKSVQRKYKNAVPVGEEIYLLYQRICEEMHIPVEKVDLVYDAKIETPCLGGMKHNYILLPIREYTEEQLRVILLHELTHYKQRNHYLRYFTEATVTIHFFNPVVWIFKKKVHYWGEHACDFEVIPRTNGAKYYFSIILETVTQKNPQYSLYSHLFESKKDLESRMKLVKRSYRMKKKSRLLAFVVVLGMFTTSTASVSAATMAAGDAYYQSFFETSEDVSEAGVEVEGVEYTAEGFEKGVILKRDFYSLINPLALTSFSWTIKANRAQSSSNFKVKAGQSIYVSATGSPSSSQFRLGIIEPNGTLRYVLATGVGGHSFAIDSDGKYAVYVQNMSDVSISVSGSYNVE